MTDLPPLSWQSDVLRPEHVREIDERWPLIHISAVESLARDRKDHLRLKGKAPRAFELRDRLEEISRKTSRLRRLLANIDRTDERVWLAIVIAAGILDQKGALERATKALEDLESVFVTAERVRVPLEPNEVSDDWLFVEAVKIISNAGFRPTRSLKGPLINVLRIVFEASGEDVDVFNFVDYRLKKVKRFSKK